MTRESHKTDGRTEKYMAHPGFQAVLLDRPLRAYNPSAMAPLLDSMHAPFVRIARSRTVVNIQNLIDDLKCFETVRELRRPHGVNCPHCDSTAITKQGHDSTRPERQRSQRPACQKHFDDLTGTVFAGRHQPLRVWILCLDFMGLNLSNEQIGHELNLDPDDAQKMVAQLREGIVERKPEEVLSGEVECDEVYVVAGHKGHPEAVKKRAASPSATVEGRTRAWDAGEGKAARLGND
jgi:transposase-like protein